MVEKCHICGKDATRTLPNGSKVCDKHNGGAWAIIDREEGIATVISMVFFYIAPVVAVAALIILIWRAIQ